MSERRLRIGVAGLGRAFTIMLPTFVGEPRVRLVATADPRQGPRRMLELVQEQGDRLFELHLLPRALVVRIEESVVRGRRIVGRMRIEQMISKAL